MDRKKITIIVIVSMLIISNLPIINTEILGRIDGAHFRYANGDASFTYIERMDMMIPWVSEWTVRKFIAAKRPSIENMEVYR